MVDDLVGVDAQAAVALGGILHQPVNDVAPELAEVAVVPLAPVAFEVLTPTHRRVSEHGKRAAAAEWLAGKDRHDARAGKPAIGGAEKGRRRLQAVGLVGAVEGRHLVEDLPVLHRIVHDAPNGMAVRRAWNAHAERLIVVVALAAGHLHGHKAVPDGLVPLARAEAV